MEPRAEWTSRWAKSEHHGRQVTSDKDKYKISLSTSPVSFMREHCNPYLQFTTQTGQTMQGHTCSTEARMLENDGAVKTSHYTTKWWEEERITEYTNEKGRILHTL